MKFYHVSPLILCIVASLPLKAQQNRSTPTIPHVIQLEDPELYFAFFRAHDGIDHEIQSTAPSAAGQLVAATVKTYQISAEDFPKLTNEVRKFMTNLAKWEAQEQAYVDQQRVAKKLPDMHMLVDFQMQRQRLVIDAHGGVRGALTASSWNALHSYINGNFRASLSQGSIAGSVAK